VTELRAYAKGGERREEILAAADAAFAADLQCLLEPDAVDMVEVLRDFLARLD
jgi:hypothetical protein